MELRGRVKGETDAKVFTMFKNILCEHCYDLPECYLFIEILTLSLEDRYRVVRSQIHRHRVVKVKEAEAWRKSANEFIESSYFDMYAFLSGVNPEFVRFLIKKIERYFLMRDVTMNINKRKSGRRTQVRVLIRRRRK